MKRQALIGLMVLGMLAFNRAASGSYSHLELIHHANVMTAAGPKWVYRLYARFTHGEDRLTGWGGGLPASKSTMNLFTVGCASGPFYQAPGGTNRAPLAEDIAFNPDLEWDTFATIGVSINDQGVPYDQTQLSSGFPNFISVTPYVATGFVFAMPTAAQTRADFTGDGDPALRVMMAQLTVDPYSQPYGHIGYLRWVDSNGQTGAYTFQQSITILEVPRRCCVPEGYCILTTHSACSVAWNGVFDPTCGPCDACELTCVPDIVPPPGNGIVDAADLLAVISSWGSYQISKSHADVSPPHGNFQVNVEDLLVVIAGWGPCP